MRSLPAIFHRDMLHNARAAVCQCLGINTEGKEALFHTSGWVILQNQLKAPVNGSALPALGHTKRSPVWTRLKRALRS